MQKMTIEQLIAFIDEAAMTLTVKHGEVFDYTGKKVAELEKSDKVMAGDMICLYRNLHGGVLDITPGVTDEDKISALMSWGSTCDKGFEIIIKSVAGMMVLHTPEETENVLRKLAELIDDTRKHYNDAQI